MIYSFAVSIPANTSKDNKQKTVLELTAGVIHQVEIVFPIGCAGFAFASIASGVNQVWPTNPGEYFNGDNESISFKEFYSLKIEPYHLDILSYNLDDTYDHTVIIRLGILKASKLRGVWILYPETGNG